MPPTTARVLPAIGEKETNPLFERYAAYTADTEPMWWYHRWCLYSAIGALLGRRFYFEHGHFQVNPNLYCMLIGDTGSRKSSAIKLMRKLLLQAGGLKIAADRSSKERFLSDLQGDFSEQDDGGESNKHGKRVSILDKTTAEALWGTDTQDDTPREIFVVADEFNDFIGTNNIEFASLLGTLWDYEGVYEYRIKTGKSARVPNPTINILGGNTAQGITIAFPQELLNQGFFGRLILIYGERSGRKITFPKKPPVEETNAIVSILQKMQLTMQGPASLSSGAADTLDKLYKHWPEMQDARFKSYANRRFTQLLKLCTINAACRGVKEIANADVILANTVLAAAEELMPRALGEFGAAKNSKVANKILDLLRGTARPILIQEIWMNVHKDLDKMVDLANILQGLEAAGKIHHIPKKGWLPKAAKRRELEFVDWELLNAEELKLLTS